MGQLQSKSYDTIGVNYSNLRKSDARIEKLIAQALGDAETVLNVGAGTGSYEPKDRQVKALEPSLEMIGQREQNAAPVVQGRAEALPFNDNTFDASMALLTVHHWQDRAMGLKEIRRVTRGPVVIHTFDTSCRDFWLADYIPELMTLDDKIMPPMSEIQTHLGVVNIVPVPIPHDCTDGFLCAYWRRPAAYLDPKVRAAISSFWAIDKSIVNEGLEKLTRDLDSGAWAQRYSEFLDADAYDFGYRLVTAK